MKVLRQFLRFGLVGVVGFAVDVAVLYLAAPSLGWYLARLLSFVSAATATWALNRRYTFASAPSPKGAGLWRQYLGYLVTMLGGGVVNYLTYAATLRFGDGHATPALGVALGSIAGLLLNFLSARYLVFRSARTSKKSNIAR